MFDRVKDNTSLFKKRDEDTAGNAAGAGEDPTQSSDSTKGLGQHPASAQTAPPIGPYSLVPDPPLRTFRVISAQQGGQVGIVEVEAHTAHTEDGSLIFSQTRAGGSWVVRIFARGTWAVVESEPLSREAIEQMNRDADQFYKEQQLVLQRIALAEAQAQEMENRHRAEVLNSKDSSAGVSAARGKNTH